MCYPCDCSAMKWMVDNNKLIVNENNKWMISWIELDKTVRGTNIETFGVKFSYCLFCGKKIKG